MRSLWMLPLFAALVLVSACAEEEGNPDDKRASEPASDYLRILEKTEEKIAYEESTDPVDPDKDPCGGLCDKELCGYTCTTPDAQCERQCAAEDSRRQSYVRFDVPETLTTVDSRNHTYEPRQSLWHVVVYGCRLWDYSNQKKDGLEIVYGQVIHGAASAKQPQEKGVEFEAYIEPYTGPGTYAATEIFFSVDSELREQGVFYQGKDLCSFNITGDGGGGLIGTFECSNIPNGSGEPDTVSITGEFVCGSNALELPQMVLLPYSIQNGMNPDPPMPDPMP